ncbi:MAG: haloacid dehalogenase type II [Neomegalonema sp.]|nr:haloacid dehalogenase type II [Neomegalonema sp.]
MAIRACVFDAYGTLFDVNAAAREAAAEPGSEVFAAVWEGVAALWRLKQLEYTWLRAITGDHADFWTVTQDSLDYTLEKFELQDSALRARLLQLYFELSAFAEVPQMLGALKQAGYKLAILSNGEPKMLAAASASAGIDGLLDAILSVQSVGIFKPAPQVYGLVTEHFECLREEVLFVSSNGWDVNSAAAYGFQAVWANRRAEPVERIGEPPRAVLHDLSDLPKLVPALG